MPTPKAVSSKAGQGVKMESSGEGPVSAVQVAVLEGMLGSTMPSPAPVSSKAGQEVKMESGMEGPGSAVQIASLEEILSLLLHQHDKLVQCFEDCFSVHDNIIQRVDAYHRCRPWTGKQEVLLSTPCKLRQTSKVLTPKVPLEPKAPEAPYALEMPDLMEKNEMLQLKSMQRSNSDRNHMERDRLLRNQAVTGCPDTMQVKIEPPQQLLRNQTSNSSAGTIKMKMELPIWNEAINSSQASSGSAVVTWSKQMEQEEELEKEAAKALCESSRGTKSAEPQTPGYLGILNRVVHGSIFESVITLAIITNAILIGVETQYMAQHKEDNVPAIFKVLGWLYILIFFVELVLRLICEGCMFFKGPHCYWNLFDLFCVACSLLEVVMEGIHEGAGVQNTNIVRVVRVVRTLRLSRTIRITSILRLVSALQILVQSIAATLKSLIWALVLMCMIVYICGIMFTQAATIHLAESDGKEEVHLKLLLYWGDLGSSMATLYQSVTGGISWRDASTPLGQMSWVWESLFVAYVSFTYFAVLNVVTGVFCNSAIDNARHEPEMVIKSLLSDQEWYEKHLKELFENLDRDRSGHISIRELEKSIDNPSVRAWFAAMGLEITDAWSLFKLIDEDHSYDITTSEFVSRCMQLRGNARSIDLALLRKEHSMTVKKLLRLADRMEENFSKDREHLLGFIAGQKTVVLEETPT